MKQLVLKDVNIRNFLSLGECSMHLQDMGFVKITGINNFIEDGATSNGAGKSSGVDAILWALTGETSRGVKDVVNNKTVGGTCVELSFEYDGAQYKVTRYRNDSKYGNNLFIEQNGQDISGKGLRDSETILAQTLPDLTSKFLGSVVILGQGLPFRFTNNTPAGRKEILETLSKSDYIIAEVKDKLSARKTVLSQELDVLRRSCTTCQAQIQSNEKRIEVNNNSILSTPEFDNDAWVLVQKQLQECNEKLSSLQSQYESAVSQRSDLYKATSAIKDQLRDVEAQDDQRLMQLRSEYDTQLAVKAASITRLQQEIRKMNSVQTHCPTCGRPYDNVHKPDTTALQQELVGIEQEYTQLSSAKQSAVNAFVKMDVSSYMQELQKNTELEAELFVQINNISKELSTCRVQRDNLSVTFSQLKSLKDTRDTKINMLRQDIDTLQKENTKLQADLQELVAQESDVSTRVNCVSQLLTYCSRDFRGYLLSNVIAFISDCASTYASKLFNSNRLCISLEGNGIAVTYDNKAYEALSGGERQKADICIQFAIRDMLIQFFGICANAIFLDELFDGCDEIGCEKLISLITELEGISSIFVITHHTDIAIPYDKEILVVKGEDGISTIQNSTY